MSTSKSLVLSIILLAPVLTNLVLGVPISLETLSRADPRAAKTTQTDISNIQARMSGNGLRLWQIAHKSTVKRWHRDDSPSKGDAVALPKRTVVSPAKDVEVRDVEKTPVWLVGIMMAVVVLSEVIKTVVVSFQAYRGFREEASEDDAIEQVDVGPQPVNKLVSDCSEAPYLKSDSIETVDLDDDPMNDVASPPRRYNHIGHSENESGGSSPCRDCP